MAARARIELLYDVVSPYSYLAFEGLLRFAPYWNAEVVLKPVLVGGILKNAGNVAPVSVPNKAVNLRGDVLALADWWGIPVKFPATFPPSTLGAQRLLTAIRASGDTALLETATRNAFRHVFGGNDITTRDALLTVLQKSNVSKDRAEALLAQSASEEIKKELKDETDGAVARGVFGVPTFFVTGTNGETKMYFGQDRFNLMGHQLGKQFASPYPPEASSKAKL